MAQEHESHGRACLEAIARGDQAAMQRFYEAHAQIVYAFALRRLDDPADAADVLHEVMLEVWRKAGRFEGRSRVRTWLLGIARHKVLDRLRALGRTRERESDIDPDTRAEADEGDDILAATRAAGEARHVRYCLQRLRDIHRQVMHLAFFQELSCAEIAQVLGCPTGTVKTRMMHARRAMKRCLQALGADT